MYVLLNNDCIYNILTYLEPFDIIKCSLINKQFNFVSKNECLWKKLFEIYFSHVKCDNNYYENYREQIKLNIDIYKTKSKDYLKNNNVCLDMNFQRVSYIPQQIQKLVELDKLFLHNNNLQTIPIYLCKLSNLKLLDLSLNKLKYIPEEIKELGQLQDLYLDRNQLISLPTSIGDLKYLEYLSIHNNKIEKLPIEINNLKNLRHFDVDSEMRDYISQILHIKNLKIGYFMKWGNKKNEF